MASYQRVALYIMYDAIENDIVDRIRNLAKDEINLTQEERDKGARRLSGREDLGLDLNQPFDLLYGLDLGEKFQVLMRHKDRMGESERSYFNRLAGPIARSIPIRNHVMHGRQLTIAEHVFVLDFAQDLLKNRDYWPNLNRTYFEYTDNPTAFVEESIRFLDTHVDTEVINNLPTPDYDDTGFLPRPSLERDLRKKLLGRHPVITVLGEGGNGKTALALRVLYDLVQANDHAFDAIVWTSAKTNELSVSGIREIENVLTGASDLIAEAASFEPGQEPPAIRLRRLLEENKILLVIDNYETVVGNELAKLAEDVPGESKLLFTSRLPVGGDLTVLVDELSAEDAWVYFKRLIQAYGVEHLHKLEEVHARKIIGRLSHKPLLIKWLVLGAKSGLDPDRISLCPETALRFCLDNVILTLGDEAQAVIIVLATLPSPATAGVIQHVSQLNPTRVNDGLAELARSGLVSIEIQSEGEKAYTVKPFARSYISRLINPDASLVNKIIKAYRNLDLEFTSERGHYNPYSMKNFKVSSRSRMVIAKKLKEAASRAVAGEFELAEQILFEAKSLDPTYFEAHRVDSFIAQQQNDWGRAIDAMETAISLAPDEPQLYFYAGGLLVRLSKNEKAVPYLARARELDPDENIVLREIARNMMILCRFDEAREVLDKFTINIDRRVKNNRILADIWIQFFIRLADFHWRADSKETALVALDELHVYLRTLDIGLFDSRMIARLPRAIQIARFLERGSEGKCSALVEYVAAKFPSLTVSRHPVGIHRGTMREEGRSDTYGFLRGTRPCDTFIHRKGVSSEDWEYLLNGGEVAFDIEPFEGRERACNISRVWPEE